MSKGSNLPAIERATGINWDHWVEHLESKGAGELPHFQIAQLAEARMDRDKVDNSGWWAQGVAVAFEQHIGRRLPGQANDGTFQFSVTKTVAEDLDDTLDRWRRTVDEMSDFNGVALQDEPRISGSEKWRYWRASLVDGTRVSVDIGRKAEKSSLAVNHAKILDPDQVESWKAYWRALLGKLAG